MNRNNQAPQLTRDTIWESNKYVHNKTSHLIAQSLERRLQQTGISMDVQDRWDVRQQRQDKTINLHSRVDVNGSNWQL